MSKEKKAISSAEMIKEAEELQKQLRALRKDIRQAKQLEEAEKAREKRNREIQGALDFVEFTKHEPFGDTGKTCFEVLTEKMKESQIPSSDVTEEALSEDIWNGDTDDSDDIPELQG